MKITSFIVVLIAALLFLFPMMKNEDSPFNREAQEEAPAEKILGEPNTYKVTYQVTRAQDESVADILWMKKAAEVAIQAGTPYFNVRDQEVTTYLDEESNQEFSVVEGIIELDTDPMRAEFDAREIEALVLPEHL